MVSLCQPCCCHAALRLNREQCLTASPRSIGDLGLGTGVGFGILTTTSRASSGLVLQQAGGSWHSVLHPVVPPLCGFPVN